MQLKKRRFLTIVFLVVFALGFTTSVPGLAQASTLSELLQKQAELQKKAAENQKKIAQKKQEVSNLQSAISDITSDISDTESSIADTENQIETTNAVINALNLDITTKQTELDGYNSDLRSAYISLYELSQDSSMEILLQSDSLSDAVTRSQYIQILQSDLQGKVANVIAIKTDLESKKKDSESQKATLQSLNDSLVKAKRSLSSKKNQQSYLLTQTQGEQAKYEELLKQIMQENNSLSDAIYRKRQELGGNVSTSGNGGYPYTSTTAADPWGFIQRQCTSYAAWRWNVIDGNSWYRGAGPAGTGDARNWPTILAPRNGYSTGSTPRVGALVVWPAGPYIGQWGHVAYVERVNGNGTINVSEYNWVKYSYTYRSDINPTDYRYGTPTYIYP